MPKSKDQARTRRRKSVEITIRLKDVPGAAGVDSIMKKSMGWRKRRIVPTGWRVIAGSATRSAGTNIPRP